MESTHWKIPKSAGFRVEITKHDSTSYGHDKECNVMEHIDLFPLQRYTGTRDLETDLKLMVIEPGISMKRTNK